MASNDQILVANQGMQASIQCLPMIQQNTSELTRSIETLTVGVAPIKQQVAEHSKAIEEINQQLVVMNVTISTPPADHHAPNSSWVFAFLPGPDASSQLS